MFRVQTGEPGANPVLGALGPASTHRWVLAEFWDRPCLSGPLTNMTRPSHGALQRKSKSLALGSGRSRWNGTKAWGGLGLWMQLEFVKGHKGQVTLPVTCGALGSDLGIGVHHLAGQGVRTDCAGLRLPWLRSVF